MLRPDVINRFFEKVGYIDQNELLTHDIINRKLSMSHPIEIEDQKTGSQFKSSDYTSDEEEESEEEDELKIRLTHEEIKKIKLEQK